MFNNLEYTPSSAYDYTEMAKLYNLCTDAHIPCEIHCCDDGLQLIYPGDGETICDAILHGSSYGHEFGLLEIMGLVDEDKIGDSVEGYLTADEVFARIHKNYYFIPPR